MAVEKLKNVQKGDKSRTLMHASVANEIIDRLNRDLLVVTDANVTVPTVDESYENVQIRLPPSEAYQDRNPQGTINYLISDGTVTPAYLWDADWYGTNDGKDQNLSINQIKSFTRDATNAVLTIRTYYIEIAPDGRIRRIGVSNDVDIKVSVID